MALKRSSLIVAVALLATGSLFAQYDTFFTGQREAAADATRRAELAEALVRSRESAGREIDGGFRRTLVDALKKESVDQLELRLASGNLAIAATALGDSRSDLTYTTFQQPCRIIDTRLTQQGIFVAGEMRNFLVAGTDEFGLQGGNDGGCGIPVGASAANINFVAVNPSGGGNLKGAAYPNSMPGTGSILNYQLLTPILNIANGLLFPLCDVTTDNCSGADITLQANGAGTHIVADVLGYSMRFPKERVKSFVVEGFSGSAPSVQIGSTCTNFPSANVTITAPPGVAGTVWVRATVRVGVHQGAPTATEGSVYEVYLQTSPGVCEGYPALTKNSVDTKALRERGRGISNARVFMLFDNGLGLAAGSSLTFTLNGQSFHEVVIGDDYDSADISSARIIAQFIPN